MVRSMDLRFLADGASVGIRFDTGFRCGHVGDCDDWLSDGGFYIGSAERCRADDTSAMHNFGLHHGARRQAVGIAGGCTIGE